MKRPVSFSSRHTGWQLVYGLRPDFGAMHGYRRQADVGCIDAPTSIAGGAVQVDDYRTLRWAWERGVPRDGGELQ